MVVVSTRRWRKRPWFDFAFSESIFCDLCDFVKEYELVGDKPAFTLVSFTHLPNFNGDNAYLKKRHNCAANSSSQSYTSKTKTPFILETSKISQSPSKKK